MPCLDDSGSIKEGKKSASQPMLSKLLFGLQLIFKNGGIRLHYIHGDDPTDVLKTRANLESQLQGIKYGGPSKLGTTVKQKIWSKIISSSDFVKPRLVYLLTDGEVSIDLSTQLSSQLLNPFKKNSPQANQMTVWRIH
jgi:hypothetical protein